MSALTKYLKLNNKKLEAGGCVQFLPKFFYLQRRAANRLSPRCVSLVKAHRSIDIRESHTDSTLSVSFGALPLMQFWFCKNVQLPISREKRTPFRQEGEPPVIFLSFNVFFSYHKPLIKGTGQSQKFGQCDQPPLVNLPYGQYQNTTKNNIFQHKKGGTHENTRTAKVKSQRAGQACDKVSGQYSCSRGSKILGYGPRRT